MGSEAVSYIWMRTRKTGHGVVVCVFLLGSWPAMILAGAMGPEMVMLGRKSTVLEKRGGRSGDKSDRHW